jgi:exodeoxyribonuclease V alpha subunit
MNNKTINNLYNRDIFRDIDIAFARLLTRLGPDDPPGVRLAGLLVSRAAGEGHVCIDLHQWAGHEIRLPNGKSIDVRCPGAEEWMDQLRSSAMVSRSDEHGPLVCDARGRVYLQRLYQHEQQLAQLLRKRASAALPTLSRAQQDTIRALLGRYFGEPHPDSAPNWQKIAAMVCLVKRLCIISGAPGTGKTTTVAKILGVLLEWATDSPLRIHLCAPTGKAAARLGASLADACRSMDCPAAIATALATLETCTIHRLLKVQPGGRGSFFHENNPLPTDVVVVDEASMVDLVMMSRLVKAVPEEARLIILGDKDQLASVEAGSVFGDLCRDVRKRNFSTSMRKLLSLLTQEALHPVVDTPYGNLDLQDCTVVLHKNYRFDHREGIGALTRAVNLGDSDQIKRTLRKNHGAMLHWDQWRSRTEFHKLLAAYALKGYESYFASNGPQDALSRFNRFMILCALAKGPFGVERLNLIIADQLQKAGLIGRTRPWYQGRPVMITRNSYRIGLFNGDTGLVWPAADGRLRVWFQGEGGALRAIRPQRLPEHQTVFAMTVHKSQGSEFDRVLLVLPDQDTPVLSRELLYTGCSRARKQLILIAQEAVMDQAVQRTIQRTSGLYEALWDDQAQDA